LIIAQKRFNSATGYALHVDNYATDPLTELMEGEVRAFLGIPEEVTWGGQSSDVFSAQSGDFMKPVIDVGEFCYLLLKLKIKKIIYQF